VNIIGKRLPQQAKKREKKECKVYILFSIGFVLRAINFLDTFREIF